MRKRWARPASLVEKIPPKVAQLRIVTSKQLNTMQKAVNLLRSLALVLPLLVFALFALAVYLARGRRHQTLIAVGVAFIGAGLVVVVARGIIGTKVVDSLATTEAVRPAAQAAWSIGTSVLADIAWSTVLIGIPLILAGLLAGSTHTAIHLRRLMAPYLRDRPDITFGTVAFILLLLFAWGPIVATKTFTGVLIIIVLAAFGTEMLRRQTAKEFPDVHTKAFLASAGSGGAGPTAPRGPDPTTPGTSVADASTEDTRPLPQGPKPVASPEQPTHEDPGAGA